MLVQKHTRTLHCFDKKPIRSVFTRKTTSEAMYRPTKWSVEDFQRYPDETCSWPALYFFIFLVSGYHLPCFKGVDASFMILSVIRNFLRALLVIQLYFYLFFFLPVSDFQRRKYTLFDELTNECFSISTANTIPNSDIVTSEKQWQRQYCQVTCHLSRGGEGWGWCRKTPTLIFKYQIVSARV